MLAGLNLKRVTATLAPAVFAAWTGLAAAAPPSNGKGSPQDAGLFSQAPEAPRGAGKPPLSPMHTEIQEAVEEEKAALRALYGRLAGTRDPLSVLEIQAGIQRAKEQTELKILEIQLRHARLAGRSDAVLQLERAIQALQAPAAPRVPAQRPLPAAGPSRSSR